ncbi:N-acetylgalactosamine-N,N'-diacetylbacillosaminyl-diphospho-undecaprenol [Marinobacterium sp. xm-a-121]|uniref:glycosyltransferase family 4 protein n=2 Tax=Marinobacterium TaxID=48075 RepID=UPI001569C73F|nr:N-acetylgalactosamine-N,N'-diacetylbacillosaminyl-diphospho-undecaprenol [Marinobacterium sp. xm-a-121]NRP59763.1 N-acetylgalactosamine-N,N'-diacetylbacillosaminyl-diphospho-undecaprenol [Marinobacterium sp. xm-d-564]NRQ00309.1 N-acetylgalactosamine-N,N'-diacetylbacillosaminyl-diphospho-undecaprenol [Marinobacterium sp. xm-v-233]
MKVLLVLASQGMGGLEKHTLELSEGLYTNGVEVHLIAPQNLCQSVQNPKIKVHHFEFANSRYNPIQLFKIYKLVRKIDPDIVHYQANKAAQIGGLLSKFLHIPAVCTIHNLKKNLSFLKSFKSTIAVSRNVAQNFPDTTTPVIIYNGIQKESLQPKTHYRNSDEGSIRWISVGRLVDAKGFDILLNAFAQVPGTLKIVGDGPRMQELTSLCTLNKLDDRVEFLGQRDDVIKLLQESDICVVSSRNEGFSYVIAEALVHQTPVISTDVPVANEFFGDEKICAVGDVNALSELMQRAANNNLNYSREFTFASENFTIEAMVNKTIDHYKTLIELK